MAFSLFGSDAAQTAADANRAALGTYGSTTGDIYNAYGTGATGAIQGGAASSLGALGTGLTSSLSALNTGLTGAQAAGQREVGAYGPLSTLGSQYGDAVNSYYNALGLRGPAGTAQTQQQFTTSPGYQFQVDEATKNAMASASRLGIAGSGNTLDAIRSRAQGFAGTEYQNYLDRLAGFVNPQLSATTAAATGTAGANQNLANINLTGYGNIAGAYGTNATQQAGIYTGAAGDVSNIMGNVATGRAQSARDIVQGNIASNNQVAQAAQQDAANFWGLLGAGARAVGSAYGRA
jgi:hypothetical protein